MIEREMEDLLWEHPERFLNEPLNQFQRQPASSVGRADLIFEDRIGRLIVIELKRDVLERGAISQLVDYYGMLKIRFLEKSVELMIIANRIPPERRLACEQYDIEAVEISQKKFRDVAEQVGYSFKSETGEHEAPRHVEHLRTISSSTNERHSASPREDFQTPSKIEKAWHYWEGKNGHGYFLAFVNAKGSCSMRRFDASSGVFLGKEYKSGDFQESFADYLKGSAPLNVSRQPNLERDCRSHLPSYILSELTNQACT